MTTPDDQEEFERWFAAVTPEATRRRIEEDDGSGWRVITVEEHQALDLSGFYDPRYGWTGDLPSPFLTPERRAIIERLCADGRGSKTMELWLGRERGPSTSD